MVDVDDSTKAFLVEVRRYCRLIEQDEDDSQGNSWKFARNCLISIVKLYSAALLLPIIVPKTADILDEIHNDNWQLQRERLVQRLSRDYYWQVFEPLEQKQPEVLVGSLSDDLTDIWRDVKEGLLEFDKSDASLDDVIWHWRSSFETHWGQHAVGAIAALNALCYGQFPDLNRPQDT